ncbi:uncharacterized protein METZ01_LOCUS382051, partial [marine metagenome]
MLVVLPTEENLTKLKSKTSAFTEVLQDQRGSKEFLGEKFRDRLGLYQLAGL